MNERILSHHGIRNQKWGVRNGPPYPLSGGQYSRAEKKALIKARKSKHNIYNKKHFDEVLESGKTLSTLSYDKDRTKNTDMFYAAHTTLDKHQYNALFNKKIPQDLYDENGEKIGTGEFWKYRINNTVTRDVKVASEDSGAEAFRQLFANDRDFYNFVTDTSRMQARFVTDKYKFRGYRESRKALDKMRRPGYIPSEDDLQKAYRMFNYIIPSDGGGDAREAKDVATQRAKFFKKLKSSGYGAVLDTNDAIYGGFKSESPVIVFDMESIVLKDCERVKTSEKYFSDLVTVGRKIIGK